jgi:hypothetical protein
MQNAYPEGFEVMPAGRSTSKGSPERGEFRDHPPPIVVLVKLGDKTSNS